MGTTYQIQARIFVTTVFDVSGLGCHVALLYMMMIALLAANTGSTKTKFLGQFFAGSCAVMGTLAIIFNSVKFFGTNGEPGPLDFWFSTFSTLFGVCMWSLLTSFLRYAS
jgi:hypothetical protein